MLMMEAIPVPVKEFLAALVCMGIGGKSAAMNKPAHRSEGANCLVQNRGLPPAASMQFGEHINLHM